MNFEQLSPNKKILKKSKKSKKVFSFDLITLKFLNFEIYQDLKLNVPGSVYQEESNFSLNTFFSKTKRTWIDFFILFFFLLFIYFYIFNLINTFYLENIEQVSMLNYNNKLFKDTFISFFNFSLSSCKKFNLINSSFNSFVIDLINS